MRKYEAEEAQRAERERAERQRAEDAERAEAEQRARAVRQMLTEARKIDEIVSEGPTGDRYEMKSAFGVRQYDADTPAKLYQSVRDNVRNVDDEEEHEHALSQIKALVDRDKLNVEQAYMLRRLLRAINPLKKTPEELETEEAEEYEELRYVSDVFMDFYDEVD